MGAKMAQSLPGLLQFFFNHASFGDFLPEQPVRFRQLGGPLCYPSLQFIVCLPEFLFSQFSVGNVADIALDDFVMVNLIDIAHKFYGNLVSAFCREG